ncbi:MAG: pyridoxine 5'-phosphate synthase [Proteobacteria bacterium]|nr:pyridoxine 5'-phosphate synthase [Pseudomonadota bacterium]
MVRLGVNLDHVATLREARKVNYPSPLKAAFIAEEAGADGITMHLRQDRRHIQERDIEDVIKHISLPVNVELAIVPEMVDIVSDLKPQHCCLVPERVTEITTEGGLNIIEFENETGAAIEKLKSKDISVSLFIEPEIEIIKKGVELGTNAIEFNTSLYSDSKTPGERNIQIKRIQKAARFTAENYSLEIHAGHGLNYTNVKFIRDIPEIIEYNIGHSIISRSVFSGLYNAIIEMKKLLRCL